MGKIFYKLISGGQTGVDRAALDVALELGILCGGWCPNGRKAEDGPIDLKYPLKETRSLNVGIPTYIDSAHAIAYNKIIVIDRETVITGPFNFTRAADERNAENLLIIKSKDLAKPCIDNWNQHKDHSEPYQARY